MPESLVEKADAEILAYEDKSDISPFHVQYPAAFHVRLPIELEVRLSWLLLWVTVVADTVS